MAALVKDISSLNLTSDFPEESIVSCAWFSFQHYSEMWTKYIWHFNMVLTFLENLLHFHVVSLSDIIMKLSFQGVTAYRTKLYGTGDWKMNSPRHPVPKESNMLIVIESEMQGTNIDSFTFLSFFVYFHL